VRIRHLLMSRVEETLLFHIGVTVMTVPTWVKPGVWGVVVGAIAIMIVGFWQIGWTTAGTAERMATDRANSAVVAVLVPFCVAMAERDPDQAKLAKVKAEQSNWSRSQLVSDAGWATMPGATTPGSCPEEWCKNDAGHRDLRRGWPEFHAAGTADSMMMGSLLNGAMVSRLM